MIAPTRKHWMARSWFSNVARWFSVGVCVSSLPARRQPSSNSPVALAKRALRLKGELSDKIYSVNYAALTARATLRSRVARFGVRVPPLALTRLEFGLLEYLLDREGQAVSRASLIQDVWGYSYTGGSNVIEAVVRSLRKKLRERASCVETVSGVGYRFRSG